jgi:uncharacterized protein YfeS
VVVSGGFESLGNVKVTGNIVPNILDAILNCLKRKEAGFTKLKSITFSSYPNVRINQRERAL